MAVQQLKKQKSKPRKEIRRGNSQKIVLLRRPAAVPKEPKEGRGITPPAAREATPTETEVVRKPKAQVEAEATPAREARSTACTSGSLAAGSKR